MRRTQKVRITVAGASLHVWIRGKRRVLGIHAGKRASVDLVNMDAPEGLRLLAWGRVLRKRI